MTREQDMTLSVMNWMVIDMNKLHQVFLSSTFSDLKDVRLNVIDGLMKAGYYPKCMEYFPASGSSQEKYISSAIDNSDIIIFLLNNRYGTEIESLDSISYTHFEYLYAAEKNKQILCFIDKDVTHDNKESEQQKEKLGRLKEKILEEKLCKIVEFKYINHSDLTVQVLASLTQSIDECQTCWVKGSSKMDLKDSYMFKSLLESSGEHNGNFEIPTQRIMRILSSKREFTFNEFISNLEFQENLGRQNSFSKSDALALLKDLLIYNHITMEISSSQEDIVFAPTGKQYMADKKEVLSIPDSLLNKHL
ncbi:MAG: DUF4062 domain-containing protein [Deferribacterales bacterium]